MHVDTLYQDETLRIGVVRNLLIANWDEAPTGAQLAALDDVRKPLAPFVLVNVIYAGVPSFSEDARRGVAHATQNAGARVALGYIILIPGFGGAAVRAFVSTSMLLARPKHPIKVFKTITASSPWVAGQLTEGTSSAWAPSEVETAFSALRADNSAVARVLP